MTTNLFDELNADGSALARLHLFRVDYTVGDGDEARFQRPIVLNLQRSGQAPSDVVGRPDDMPGALEQVQGLTHI